MSPFLIDNGFDYTMSKKRAYSTNLNMLSATQKFKYLEYLHDGIKVIDPIMDITFWKEDVKINFR